MVKRLGDLEIEQDVKFEKREWIFQRAGWAVMATIVIAALLGFFGAGPFSLTEVQDDSGNLSVTYEHFGRRGATTDTVVEIAPAAIEGGEANLWVSERYLESVQVDQIIPTPDQVAAVDGGFLYTFLVDKPDEGLEVTFDLTIEAMGLKSGDIGLEGADPVHLVNFFTP